MSVCACGRIANDGRLACERCAAVATFGLTRGATQAEIKDAYRALAKVWHPDRFQNDEQLRGRAEEKLKEINSAYQVLTTTPPENSQGGSPGQAPAEQESQRASAATSARTHWQPPRTSHFNSSLRTMRPANRKRLVVTLVVLLAAGIPIYYWLDRIASPVTDGSHTQTESGTAGPLGQKSKANQATNNSAKPAEKKAEHTRANAAASGQASLVVYPDEDPQVPYFTVGSSKDDVLRIQGTPSRIAGNIFRYGLSEVYFKNGRVESWYTDPRSPLKARVPQQ
jgi:hypothetical protein